MSSFYNFINKIINIIKHNREKALFSCSIIVIIVSICVVSLSIASISPSGPITDYQQTPAEEFTNSQRNQNSNMNANGNNKVTVNITNVNKTSNSNQPSNNLNSSPTNTINGIANQTQTQNIVDDVLTQQNANNNAAGVASENMANPPIDNTLPSDGAENMDTAQLAVSDPIVDVSQNNVANPQMQEENISINDQLIVENQTPVIPEIPQITQEQQPILQEEVQQPTLTPIETPEQDSSSIVKVDDTQDISSVVSNLGGKWDDRTPVVIENKQTNSKNVLTFSPSQQPQKNISNSVIFEKNLAPPPVQEQQAPSKFLATIISHQDWAYYAQGKTDPTGAFPMEMFRNYRKYDPNYVPNPNVAIDNTFTHSKGEALESNSYIVLHSTEHAPSETVEYITQMLGEADDKGANFVVGPDGHIYNICGIHNNGWHAGYGDYDRYGVDSMNANSVGIEIYHSSYLGDWEYPEVQLRAVSDLIAYIDANTNN